MSFTDYFIKKPVLATVINLLILVSGLLAMSKLGLREYPAVSSPVYSIEISYPNASADVMESEVATPLRRFFGRRGGCRGNHVNFRLWMDKYSLKFKSGTDLAKAQSGIRDSLSMTRGVLPKEINEPSSSTGK